MRQQISKEEDHKEVSQKTKRRAGKIPKAIRPEEFKLYSSIIPAKDKVAKISSLLAYGAGLRLSEVIKCEPQHFQGDKLFIPESKYGVERFVPIPKGWKEDFYKELPLCQGKSMSTASRMLQRKFRKYSKLAKLPDHYTFHSNRHGFATRCLESGMPLNMVQVLLGHANISTTSVYVKANPIDAIKNYMENF